VFVNDLLARPEQVDQVFNALDTLILERVGVEPEVLP
jgi:hypothetical protein